MKNARTEVKTGLCLSCRRHRRYVWRDICEVCLRQLEPISEHPHTIREGIRAIERTQIERGGLDD